ncbi:MAG: hypothetical protein ACRDKT_09700 [Actinomycetota bacterium]
MGEPLIPPEAIEPHRDAVALMRNIYRGDTKASQEILAHYEDDAEGNKNELFRAALVIGATLVKVIGGFKDADPESLFDELALGYGGLDSEGREPE